VDLQIVRLPGDQVEPLDTDGDGRLDKNELTAWLASDLHHLRLQILLSDKPNRSDLKVDIPEAAAEFCSATPGRRGRTRLLLDDMPVEIRARGGGGESRSFLVNFLLQRMSIYDADKNGYLTEDEYPELQQQLAEQLNITAEFASADLNGDQMLVREELKTFIEQDAIATQSRIDVSVRQDGKTLFQLLDVNRDRRLSPRELMEGFQVLQPFDQNQDQLLTESELGTEYTLEIGLGQAESMRLTSMSAMSMQARSTDAILPGVEGLDGPEWFRRMDRNQDRDVSYREFPGPRHFFETLDTDHNGLLSAQEAEQLKQPQP
jgi:Ca2+-binding EF-hand superfamily protein